MSITPYQQTKSRAKALGVSMRELLALAPGNDPFYCGQPAQLPPAEWFAAQWRRLGGVSGMHQRRMHYQFLGGSKHDGKTYENTERDWNYLENAFKCARYLRLVPAHAFEDHRNPPPLIFDPTAPAYHNVKPGWSMDEVPEWRLPQIETDLGRLLSFPIPDVEVSGYDYHPSDQPVHVEVWIEKSTMNDVLVPVCRELHADFVPGIGFMTVTAAVNLLRRARSLGKPTRIFYVSDFDPAGSKMPRAVARQVEFWWETYAPGLEIKLTQLGLTPDQVAEYGLPRVPIKDSDRRKGNFEAAHGEGCVELDALEALHPGELARIVRQAIEPYRDASLSERLADAKAEARDEARAAWHAATATQRAELRAVRGDAHEILAEFTRRLEVLQAELEGQLQPVRERLAVVWQAIQDTADSLRMHLPDRPGSELEEVNEGEWLFDNQRSYDEQLSFYKGAPV